MTPAHGEQKQAFLEGEGDAWFSRNEAVLGGRDWSNDPLIRVMGEIGGGLRGAAVLEIGCGPGHRLHELQKRYDCRVTGIDPSRQAVEYARALGVQAEPATADKLPFANETFEIVILGFCLYLCDRSDLFAIAAEVHRVCKTPGWVAIQDFFSKGSKENVYRHRAGLKSYKMDYSTMFAWHPWYTRYSHRVWHHQEPGFTDSVDDWVGVTLLRKHPGGG